MMKRFDASLMTYVDVKEREETQCIIPIGGTFKVNLEVRSAEPVLVNVVTASGETVPLDHGMIVRWSGKLEDCSGVEIVATTGFWYLCQKQGGWFETVDPTPMVVELRQTSADVLRTMIDERLRQYTARMKLERDLTEDEKDELILDIASGDLEFENEPDEFGLGYEERLKEFIAKQSEPADAVEPPVTPPAAVPAGGVPTAVVEASSEVKK